MSLYTTPLQFGYFFSLLMWILLLVRGYRQQRLSDKLLGWVMFILAMELQDYTFGFAGINVLWNELNGFPRGVSLLFGPIVYFYFQSQVNRNFAITKRDLWHFTPYVISFLYHISAFIRGPEAVQAQQESALNESLFYVYEIVRIGSFVYYLYCCLSIYRSYRAWSENQFSNLALIDFKWFRNFIYAMIFWLFFRECMMILDFLLDLAFYQDWWWNLALVAVAFYVGLAGYAQPQPAKINFHSDSSTSAVDDGKNMEVPVQDVAMAEDHLLLKQLNQLMQTDRLYLQADLTLQELAQHLQTNSVLLSNTINQQFKKNFNDYINAMRVEEFIRRSRQSDASKYTLLSLALDAGFNSKATFNRAFKKMKGSSPKEFLSQQAI